MKVNLILAILYSRETTKISQCTKATEQENIIAKIENSFIVLTIAWTEQRVNLRTDKLIIYKTEAQRQKEWKE